MVSCGSTGLVGQRNNVKIQSVSNNQLNTHDLRLIVAIRAYFLELSDCYRDHFCLLFIGPSPTDNWSIKTICGWIVKAPIYVELQHFMCSFDDKHLSYIITQLTQISCKCVTSYAGAWYSVSSWQVICQSQCR